MGLGKITEDEKAYLGKFTSLQCLCLNLNELVSLENLPTDAHLQKLELSDNKLTGAELVHLKVFANTLRKLKLANNNITVFEDLDHLVGLKHLKSLELSGNPVAKLSDFKARVFKLLPQLDVLDKKNRIGETVVSDSENEYGDEDFGEGGEDEIDE